MKKLYVDGGCLGNSQKIMSLRKMVWVVTDNNGEVLVEEIEDGGSNNIAEFLAIKSALKYCVDNNIKDVNILTDSYCAFCWYHYGVKKGKKMNDVRRVLEIEMKIREYAKNMNNISIERISRNENLAGHHIEKKYNL